MNSKSIQRFLHFSAFMLLLGVAMKPGVSESVFTWLVKPLYITRLGEFFSNISIFIMALTFYIMGIYTSIYKTQIDKSSIRILVSYIYIGIFFIFIYGRDIYEKLLNDEQFYGLFLKLIICLVIGFFWCIYFFILKNYVHKYASFDEKEKAVKPICSGSAVFVIYNFLIFIFDRSSVIGQVGRMYGTTDHPNFFGIICALSMLMCFIILIDGWFALTKPERFLYISGLICAIFGSLLSGSRTSFLMMIAGVFSYLIFMKGRIFFSVFILFIFLSIGFFFVSYSETYFGIEEVRTLSTENTRDEAWRYMYFEFIRSPLFGVGLTYLVKSENSYLRILSSSGLIGFSLFIIILLGSIKNIFFCIKKEHKKKLPILRSLTVSVLIALFVGAVFEGYLVESYSYAVVVFQFFFVMSYFVVGELKNNK